MSNTYNKSDIVKSIHVERYYKCLKCDKIICEKCLCYHINHIEQLCYLGTRDDLFCEEHKKNEKNEKNIDCSNCSKINEDFLASHIKELKINDIKYPDNHIHEALRTKCSKIIVVGDVHGDLNQLMYPLIHFLKNRREYRKIIYLGDYIDRGESNVYIYEIIRWIMKDVKDKDIIFLRGNHETMDSGADMASFIELLKDVYKLTYKIVENENNTKWYKSFINPIAVQLPLELLYNYSFDENIVFTFMHATPSNTTNPIYGISTCTSSKKEIPTFLKIENITGTYIVHGHDHEGIKQNYIDMQTIKNISLDFDSSYSFTESKEPYSNVTYAVFSYYNNNIYMHIKNNIIEFHQANTDYNLLNHDEIKTLFQLFFKNDMLNKFTLKTSMGLFEEIAKKTNLITPQKTKINIDDYKNLLNSLITDDKILYYENDYNKIECKYEVYSSTSKKAVRVLLDDIPLEYYYKYFDEKIVNHIKTLNLSLNTTPNALYQYILNNNNFSNVQSYKGGMKNNNSIQSLNIILFLFIILFVISIITILIYLVHKTLNENNAKSIIYT